MPEPFHRSDEFGLVVSTMAVYGRVLAIFCSGWYAMNFLEPAKSIVGQASVTSIVAGSLATVDQCLLGKHFQGLTLQKLKPFQGSHSREGPTASTFLLISDVRNRSILGEFHYFQIRIRKWLDQFRYLVT